MPSDIPLDTRADATTAPGPVQHGGRRLAPSASAAAQSYAAGAFDGVNNSAGKANVAHLGCASSARRYSATKDQLKNRVRRAEGQVRGVERMIDEDRRWVEVLTQIAAIQAALDKIALALLHEHVAEAMTSAPRDDRDDKVNELMVAIGRIMRR